MNECKNCKSETTNPKFCSRSCSVSFTNKGKNRHNTGVKKCKECNNILDKNSKTYCDNTCFNLYQFKNKTLPKFQKGEIKWNSTIKKILIYLFGEHCKECKQGNTWKGKPLALQVDHIDGNSDNCLPSNLRLLCPNCHSQTETFGWTGEVKQTYRNKYLRDYKN